MIVAASELVGRAVELARLQARLTEVTAGRGGAVAVMGQAGMGKSRLVRDALAGYGGRRWVGRCAPEGSALRPWVEIALAAVRDGADLAHRSVADFRPVLAALVPVPGVEPAGVSSPLVLAEGVLRLAATVGPPVVVIEDLHWADADSLAVLDYVMDHAATAPILVLVTLREEAAGPATDALHAAVDRRAAEPVRLGRLAPEAVEAMARRCLGAPSLPTGLEEFLERHAEGRPFFVEEMLAGLLQDGSLRREGDSYDFDRSATAAVPPSYATWTADRLATIGPQTAVVLQAAAVLGREFDADLLGPTVGAAREAVGAALRTGIRLQLLEPTPGAPGRLRFRHALGREAVRASLLPGERARLAGAALDALDSLGRDEALPGAEELAASLALAAGRRERAAYLLMVAGRAAAKRGALAAAVTLLEQAASACAGDMDATAEAEESLVETLSLAGDAERALRIGYRLLRTLDATGASASRSTAARLAVARAAAAAGRLSEARDLLAPLYIAPAGTSARIRADALAALVALESGDSAEAAMRARNALAAARSADEPAAACEALEILGRLAREGDLAAARRLFDEGEVVAERNGLRLWRARALHEVATIEFLDTLGVAGLHQARTAAVEAGAGGLVAAVDLHLAAIHGVRFEAVEALAAAERSVDASLRLGLRHQAGFGWVCVAQAHAVAGQRAGTERAAARARELAPGNELEAYLWGQCQALVSLLEEDRGRASIELGRSMEYVRSGGPVSVAPYRVLWPLVVTLDGEAAAGTSARADAATPDVLTHTVARGLLAYAEAIAVGRSGDRAAAAAAFDQGEREFSRLELPQGYHQLGRRLIAEAALTDGWGEPAAWLAEARDWFSGRGLGQTAAACRALLRRAGVPQRRRGRGDTTVPAALAQLGVTAREADVLRLVAIGLSNNDIAGRLYLAPRTVKTHIEHLLAKTALASRVQLAALAIAEGLGPPGPGS